MPERPESEHLVQFYEDDSRLLDSLEAFIGGGLAAGEAATVIATGEHRDALARRLRAAGHALEAAEASRAYVALDAAETLARIIVDGVPDPTRFAEVVGPVVEGTAGAGRRRVFGEMVGLLFSRGQVAAAVRLEELWSGLLETRALRLFCAYRLDQAEGRGLPPAIVDICARHARVVPAGRSPDITQGRLSELEVQVEDLRRLHETSVRLTSLLDVEAVLREVLEAAMAVQGTRLGLLSLRDPAGPGLRLGVHAGFDAEFLRHVASVPPGAGACGTAYAEARRVVVEDVEADPVFAPYREAAREAGFRSCHSTPLVSRRGDVIGVLAVMFVGSHRPSNRETRLMDLYARIAADSIESARLHERLQEELEDRRRSLEREHIARAEAERANRIKDEFLATVSHELRTPLNAILGWSHILRAGRPDEATLTRAVEVIERNAQTQAQLVEDILDASRVIAGSVRLVRGPVDLAVVINAAIDSVRRAAEAKGLQLAVTLDPSARRLEGDASRLQQVVWNLLANAIKFTSPGGRVDVRLERADGGAQITVRDTGEGVAAEFLPFVFDRFRQADSTITRRHGGLGLGLTIVRHLVELHGGTVEAQSAGEGYGTSFIVRLPLTESAEGPRAGAVGGGARPVLQGLQILVVDDDQDALDVLTLILTEAGAAVRTAASASEALALLRWIRPDVLISDLAMPDEDGYSLIRNLRAIERESGRETPAIALTAYVRLQDRARAVAAGFNIFVEKPVNPDELIAVLAGIAESRPGRLAQAAPRDVRIEPER